MTTQRTTPPPLPALDLTADALRTWLSVDDILRDLAISRSTWDHKRQTS